MYVVLLQDFRNPFAQECFEVTPAAGKLFVHTSRLLDKSCKELLFQVSQQYKTERPVVAPKSLEPESREDFPGFTAVQADNLCKVRRARGSYK